MKPSFALTLLVLLLHAQIASAQYDRRRFGKPEHAHYQEAHVDLDDYHLSDRIFIRWDILGLIPYPRLTPKIGLEYCFSERYGIGIEGGPILVEFDNIGNHITVPYLKSGYALYPDFRYYFGFRSFGRGYTGLQAFYRSEAFGDGRNYGDQGNVYYEYTQTSGQKTVYGIGPQVGFSTRMRGHMHFEMGCTAGIKSVNWNRNGYIIESSKTSTSTGVIAQNENEIPEHQMEVYAAFNLRFSWIIGKLQ